MSDQKPLLHEIHPHDEIFPRAADFSLLGQHNGDDCNLCKVGPQVDFSMAFQPIVDVAAGKVVAYEALARGPRGEPASTILQQGLHGNRFSMDQRCREKAIMVSSSLGFLKTDCDLSINFNPNAVYQPTECLKRTLRAAESANFPLERIIFEVTEGEEVEDHRHLRDIMCEYRKHGLRIAIDDFGNGHSGLNLLAIFQPDLLKIDRALIECIHERKASRAIVRSIVQLCEELSIKVIGEGVESKEERAVLNDLGITWMQGYFFAKPGFESLPLWSEQSLSRYEESAPGQSATLSLH